LLCCFDCFDQLLKLCSRSHSPPWSHLKILTRQFHQVWEISFRTPLYSIFLAPDFSLEDVVPWIALQKLEFAELSLLLTRMEMFIRVTGLSGEISLSLEMFWKDRLKIFLLALLQPISMLKWLLSPVIVRIVNG